MEESSLASVEQQRIPLVLQAGLDQKNTSLRDKMFVGVIGQELSWMRRPFGSVTVFKFKTGLQLTIFTCRIMVSGLSEET